MNKNDLVEEVAKVSGFSKKNAEKAVTHVLESIFDALKHGKEVRLAGFGKFDVQYREARVGRNRKSGEQVELPAGNIPVFTAAVDLKKALNHG
ncbi:HU family DNA-binding protein [Paenibacillus sp. IB182496]|uniref:HU family DNA-binding protein n=1 Tax=Paenibacillus sabuli TaxID=2772509 RepID=A0A927GU67_9BACL|nr:HU family DNA-binding protein [Paenibacillus sabuli]MBD2848609.1 HU family DNA-binding protein [Paenibacillus sabuli]